MRGDRSGLPGRGYVRNKAKRDNCVCVGSEGANAKAEIDLTIVTPVSRRQTASTLVDNRGKHFVFKR